MYRCDYCNTLNEDVNKTCVGCGSREYIDANIDEYEDEVLEVRTNEGDVSYINIRRGYTESSCGISVNDCVLNNRAYEKITIEQ